MRKGSKVSITTRKKISLSCKGKTPWNKGKKGVMANQEGIRNPNYKGGSFKDKEGYILIKNRKHPFCNACGYIRRSRLVMEKHLGRYLLPVERIHHRGIKYPLGSIKNKQDDRIENLKLFANQSKHMKYHRSLN